MSLNTFCLAVCLFFFQALTFDFIFLCVHLRSLRVLNKREYYEKNRKRLRLSSLRITRGQSNLTKSASRGAHSPVRGHPRGSKLVPLNSWGRGSY